MNHSVQPANIRISELIFIIPVEMYMFRNMAFKEVMLHPLVKRKSTGEHECVFTLVDLCDLSGSVLFQKHGDRIPLIESKVSVVVSYGTNRDREKS